MSDAFEREKIVTRKEYMIQFRNQWQEKLCAKVVDYYRALQDKKDHPGQKEMTEFGPISIEQKVDSLAESVKSSVDMLARYEEAVNWTDEEFKEKIKDILEFIDKPKLNIVVPK